MKKTVSILLMSFLLLALPTALAEQTILTTVVPSEHTLTVSYGEGGTITVNGTALTVGESVTIERHERVVIEIRPNPGFELDTATVSSDYGVSLQGNNIVVAEMVQDIIARVDFTRTSASYTVSFDANGGTGTMADVTGVSGTYTLPVCGFTAPDGKQFKTWQIDTTEHPAGTSIEVTTDITVTAVWENISPIVPDKNVIITAPTSEQIVEVYEGEMASMTVTAENAETYQWFIDYGDGTGWHKRSENHPSYTTSPVTLANNGYRYKCVVTGTNGSTAESAIFTLRVLQNIELPETGDNINPPLLCAMLLISCFGILMFRKHRKQTLN